MSTYFPLVDQQIRVQVGDNILKPVIIERKYDAVVFKVEFPPPSKEFTIYIYCDGQIKLGIPAEVPSDFEMFVFEFEWKFDD